MEAKKKHIVIIGGSYAGLWGAKTICTKLKDDVRVTLISPNTYAYFNIAAPRILVEPEKVEKALFSLSDLLNRFSSKIELLEGRVVKADLEEKTVHYTTQNETRTVNYDYLVIASGVSMETNCLQNELEGKRVVEEIKKMNQEIQQAKSIVILGGGPTGVEVAGELGYYYGQTKDITVITGKTGPLTLMGENASKKAEVLMRELNISVINDVKYTWCETLSSRTRVHLENGTSMEVDLVINTAICKPNTDFLEQKYVDEKEYLKTDQYFRLKDHNEVIGLGDVLAIGARSLFDLLHYQIPTFATFVNTLSDRNKNQLKPYQKPKQTTVIPISEKGGVGLFYGWQVPSFLVRLLKGRDYMLGRAENYYK